MRNADRTLSAGEGALVATRTRQLRPIMERGGRVTLEYVKRDGTASQSTGVIDSIVCKGSKGTVTLIADGKGYRSINLYGVTRVVAL